MTGAWLPVALAVAGGMELWARFAHRALWHGVLYAVHRSHHRPSTGWFEANDVFAVFHAVPAAGLIIWGLSDVGLVRELAFGAGAGMTAFGAAYFAIHDGYIHGRLPLGFLDRFRSMRRIKSAHVAHHRQDDAAPYGLFLGPQELRAQSRHVAARRQAAREAARSL